MTGDKKKEVLEVLKEIVRIGVLRSGFRGTVGQSRRFHDL